MFETSKVALICGSAGTGKSTLINHIAHLFHDVGKLFIAQTNPAVDNLRRRVTASNCEFSTITKVLNGYGWVKKCDILFIDECSTVSNENMKKILEKVSFKLLVLVGDIYQIESIRFGNWFNLAMEFLPKTSVFTLKKPYRTNDNCLLLLWGRVREMEENIIETIARNNYSSSLNESLFCSGEDDEIILCLNYDGIYGINNINRFLQEANNNQSVQWGINKYKKFDPVLFTETDRFYPVIYNNMKGKILDVRIVKTEEGMECLRFDVELDKVINGMDADGMGFTLLGNSNSGKSTIRFCVNKILADEEDDSGNSSSLVPFQVAYAISIHKAQGLEYDSVKVVISEDVDKFITHNIFYTAITRSRKKLKIYWSPEVENEILSNMKPGRISYINFLKERLYQ